MTTSLDLSHIPLADNHCHGVFNTQFMNTIDGWPHSFTESKDLEMRRSHVKTTLFYQRLISTLAHFLGCPPEEQAVLSIRKEYDAITWTEKMFLAAHFDTLFIDTGFPKPEHLFPLDSYTTLAHCRIAPMLRVENLMQEIIKEQRTLSAVIEQLKTQLQDIRAQGYVALKSIAAYRTGLAIRTWDMQDVSADFKAARQQAEALDEVRIHQKPLLDTLLHVVFEEAAKQEVPIQFHTGYGDADMDMLLANPLHLRPIFEKQEYRGMPVVLLHESYPYTREGAYLAAVYDNAYLDLSYGIPFLGYQEMLHFTRAAFDVAPCSKLLYSSDGIGLPEMHWMSALNGRSIIGQVLDERVISGELTKPFAEHAAISVLRDNALKLYGV